MKLNILAISALLFGAAFVSCSDESETLTPSGPDVNYFEVPADYTGDDAQLRRDFYKQTGSYLIFNDLLWTGYDVYGNYHEERVDFNWNIVSDNSSQYQIEYFETLEEKEKATAIFRDEFLPYLESPSGNKAFDLFSVGLFPSLGTINSSSKRFVRADYINGWRCFALNLDGLMECDDYDRPYEVRSLIINMIQTMMDVESPELAEFQAPLEEIFDGSASCEDYFDDWLDLSDDEKYERVYELGFLTYYPSSWFGDEFPYRKSDFRNYLNAVMNQTREEFYEEWADYPLILQRYDLFVEALDKLGFNPNPF